MISARAWFAEATSGAPEALRVRAAQYLDRHEDSTDLPGLLARAAFDALAATLEHEGGRAIALDLLAADALVTLALKAGAERNPAGLAGFAAGLREAGGGVGVPSR